jgi:hypothetical protein
MKIPVGATIAHAYRFAFGNFLNMLKVIWLPAVLGVVLGLYIQGRALEMNAAIDAQLFARAGQLFFMLLPFYLAGLFFFFMELEGATRLALGLLPAPGFYYLQLGRPLWRLIGAMLLGALIMIGAVIAAFLLVVLLGALSGIVAGGLPAAGAGLGVIVVALLFYGAMIYGAARLFFFLSAVVIAEEQTGLTRSWALGRKNFWRILGVEIGALLPLFLVVIGLVFAFAGPPPMPSPGMDQAALHEAGRAWQMALTAKMTTYWYLVFPVSLVSSVLMLCLACGAQAFAYRAVTQSADGPWSSASRP